MLRPPTWLRVLLLAASALAPRLLPSRWRK